MDPADLLDYALDRLDEARRERIERMLAQDPALAEWMNHLIRNLVRLLDDGLGDRSRDIGAHPPEEPTPPDPRPD
jgi:anti-sigma factor RsiW